MTDRSWIRTLCFTTLVSTCVVGMAWTTQTSAQGLTPKTGLESVGNLSIAEMVARGKSDINLMKGIRAKVLETLEETRKNEKDLVKLDCVNGKLSSIKGFLKVGEQSLGKLETAKNKESAKHQFSLVSLATTKVQNLGVEAQSCAGEVLRYTGKTKVTPDISEDIANIDPTNIVKETGNIFRIPEGTPYQ